MSLPNRPYLNTPRISPEYFRQNNRNPLPPQTGLSSYVYPTDLVDDQRNMYIQIEFVKYEKRSVFSPPFLSPLGGVALPIPKKINDQQAVVWEAVSGGMTAAAIEAGKAANAAAGGGVAGAAAAAAAGATAGASYAALGAGSAAAGSIGIDAGIFGAELGKAPNPFLTMLFKSGQFKEHTLNWTFTPHNQQESYNLVQIIQYFKYNMLPSYFGGALGGGLLLNYPNIAILRLYPDDFFTYRFKPCAIASVSTDYSGGGQPSFFENGAPTVINFSMQLKEIELWTQEDYGANW